MNRLLNAVTPFWVERKSPPKMHIHLLPSLVEKGRCFRQTVAVKLIKYSILVLPAIVLAGCWKPAASSPPPPPENSVPTQAQPKLQTMPLFIGAETLDTELALTPREQETGMMFRTNVTDESAMLFVMQQQSRASFWMTNCPVSLSAAYIGPDGVIEEIHHFEKNDCVPVVATNDNIQYVLEVNDGWFQRHNINPGMFIRTDKGSLQQTFFGNQ